MPRRAVHVGCTPSVTCQLPLPPPPRPPLPRPSRAILARRAPCARYPPPSLLYCRHLILLVCSSHLFSHIHPLLFPSPQPMYPSPRPLHATGPNDNSLAHRSSGHCSADRVRAGWHQRTAAHQLPHAGWESTDVGSDVVRRFRARVHHARSSGARASGTDPTHLSFPSLPPHLYPDCTCGQLGAWRTHAPQQMIAPPTPPCRVSGTMWHAVAAHTALPFPAAPPRCCRTKDMPTTSCWPTAPPSHRALCCTYRCLRCRQTTGTTLCS